MLGERSRIRKVAIVENAAPMLPRASMEMALGLPNVLLFAMYFLHSIRWIRVWIYSLRGHVYIISLW